jgi:hypothetical protein
VPITGRSAIGFGLWCARAGDVDRNAGVAREADADESEEKEDAEDAEDDAAVDEDAVAGDGHATVGGARRGEAGACCGVWSSAGTLALACHRCFAGEKVAGRARVASEAACDDDDNDDEDGVGADAPSSPLARTLQLPATPLSLPLPLPPLFAISAVSICRSIAARIASKCARVCASRSLQSVVTANMCAEQTRSQRMREKILECD